MERSAPGADVTADHAALLEHGVGRAPRDGQAHRSMRVATVLVSGFTMLVLLVAVANNFQPRRRVWRGDLAGAVVLSSASEKLAAHFGAVDFFDFVTPEEEKAAAEEASLSDGNPCQDDEESYLGLCYKTCRELTGGKHPKRSSPFTCCKPSASGGCGLKGHSVKMSVCGGYDVAGDLAGGGCPHQPGKCMDGEEMHLGMCYKKCEDLTDGKYNHRVAASTCCNTKGYHCLAPGSTSTEQAYNVGNGKGAQAKPHWPLKSLTEKA